MKTNNYEHNTRMYNIKKRCQYVKQGEWWFNLLLVLQEHQMQVVPTFNYRKNLPDPLRHSSDKVLSRHHLEESFWR